MLTHLHISDFTLVDSLDLELEPGLTVITGETGAGKSILLDALGLALGDRADADKVRQGAKRADIHAQYDITKLKQARRWLKENDLEQDSECLLRRVITAEGRSRAYINGQSVTLQQLKSFGEMLIDVHSQHEHQSLLKTDTHRRLLDDYANTNDLANKLRQAFQSWQALTDEFERLQNDSEEISARFQLLSYQVEELNQLDVQEGEVAQLEREQNTLAHGETILRNSQQVVELCGGMAEEDGGKSLKDQLNHALQLLHNLPEKSLAMAEAESMLSDALIQVEEAQREVEHEIHRFDMDPQRLLEVEQRLSAIYDIARKHRIAAEEIQALHLTLNQELESLNGSEAHLEQLQLQVREALDTYTELAQQLKRKRQQAAPKLAKAVNQQLHALSMESAELKISLNSSITPSKHGSESIEFLISTNPGQSHKALVKIASGGELSRISLAIQVVTAQTSTTPTLVFDEVDVGIGGATGDVVGKLLRQLGQQGQVLCVTHLAQVASKAHQHLRVEKTTTANSATTALVPLEGQKKISEIARMIGGASHSKQSIAHARAMIEQV